MYASQLRAVLFQMVFRTTSFCGGHRPGLYYRTSYKGSYVVRHSKLVDSLFYAEYFLLMDSPFSLYRHNCAIKKEVVVFT